MKSIVIFIAGVLVGIIGVFGAAILGMAADRPKKKIPPGPDDWIAK